MASSAKETDSLAPLVKDQASQANEPHQRKGWFKHLSRGGKDAKPEGTEKHKKKRSISDSGPYVFVFDPNLGKSILRRNPHWPNEDSWKREQATKGKWAMGSMGGQQSVDFGGTTG